MEKNKSKMITFKNVRIIDPESNRDSLGSLTIDNGIIELDLPVPKIDYLKDLLFEYHSSTSYQSK